MRHEVLRLDHIGRSVNNQIINDISLTLYRQEALCVLTEDIDTKNFLLDYFQGHIRADQGNLYINDNPKFLFDLEQARQAGIYVVEENQLISSLNVADNLYLNDSTFYNRFHFREPGRLHLATKELLSRFSLDEIRPNARIHTLSPADVYLLSILRAYTSGAKIIILNTPSFVFSLPQETKRLQRIVRILKEDGLSILWFSNKWHPVFQNFDRFAVIINGVVTQQTKLTMIPPIIPENDFITSAMKRSFLEREQQKEVLRGLQIPGADRFFQTFSFSLYQGEILGICDRENILVPFMHTLAAGKAPKLGSLLLDGCRYHPDFHLRNQIAFITPSRGPSRIFPQMNLCDNVSLLLKSPLYNAAGFMNMRIRNHMVFTALKSIQADNLIEKYGIKHPLGNITFYDQIMIEIAKWLCLKPKVFIFTDPYSIYDNLSENHFSKLLGTLQGLDISLLLISGSEENLSKFCTRIINTES